MAENKKARLSSGLWVDLYELAMAQVYFRYKNDQSATFELFVRSDKRPFYVAYGVGEALDYIQNIRFSKQDIEYLRGLGMFDEKFLKYLKRFKFKGDVWAVEEPEIIFSQEPILQVSGGIVEAQIIESAVLNIINLHSTLLTKAVRVVSAAKARKIYDFSLRRTQGKEASLVAAKVSFVAGAKGTAHVLAGEQYGIPVVGTMAHSFVTSFSSELDSFRAFSRVFPKKTILLIDTYGVKEGLDNAMCLAEEIKKDKPRLVGVRIDSGNLLELSKYVRRELDAAGLIDVIIFASGDLDEYKVKELVDKRAPIDAFGVGTHMGTSSDLPFSDVIYKMVEITDAWGNVWPVMKSSENKATLPYRKQVFRKTRAKKKLKNDVIGLASEKTAGRALLSKVIKKGERVKEGKDIFAHKKKLKDKLNSLPSSYKDAGSSSEPPLLISPRLEKAREKTRELIETRMKNKTKVFFDIDTQIDFVERKGALYVKNAHRLKTVWKDLNQFAFKNGITVFSSQDAHRKRDPEFKKFPPHCVKGEKGYEKISQTLLPYSITVSLQEHSDDELFRVKEKFSQIVIEKQVLDVFSNPNTKKLVDILKPAEVYIYGVTTEFCVRCAALGLADKVDKVFVIEDAVKEIDADKKNKTFSELKKKGVKFIKAKEAMGK